MKNKKLKFYEEINRKHEIAIISLEEENLRMETEFDQKTLIWEHREADLERSLENLRKQHQMIENLAINVRENRMRYIYNITKTSNFFENLV